MLTPDDLARIEALADRTLNAKGHETYGYGQGSYDGDACRTCSWQGPPHSAQAHQGETRRVLLVEIIGEALAAEREAAEQRLTDLRDAVLALHTPYTQRLLTDECVMTHYHHRSDPKADLFTDACEHDVEFCRGCTVPYSPRGGQERRVAYPCATVEAVARVEAVDRG